MGARAAAERAARVVRKTITNYALRITHLKLAAHLAAFLSVYLAATSVFAQNRTDFQSLEISLANKIEAGNTEEKRDALAQIRSLESAEASRIAVPALRDRAEIVRTTAAFSVIFLPPDEALAALLPLLKDKKELVRRETAYALGKVGSSQATNALLQILQKDKVFDVRAAAAAALGEIGDVAAVPELAILLQRKPKTAEEFLRRSAARSIGQIAQIIQTGKTEVVTPENFLPEKYQTIEAPKYLDLSEIFPVFRAANVVLIQTLQNPREADDVKREAAFALGAVGEPSSVSVLQTKLSAKDYYLAEICREALRKIRLIETLKDAPAN